MFNFTNADIEWVKIWRNIVSYIFLVSYTYLPLVRLNPSYYDKKKSNVYSVHLVLFNFDVEEIIKEIKNALSLRLGKGIYTTFWVSALLFFDIFERLLIDYNRVSVISRCVTITLAHLTKQVYRYGLIHNILKYFWCNMKLFNKIWLIILKLFFLIYKTI